MVEQPNLEEIANQVERAPFVFRGIDEGEYDRNTFVNSLEHLSELGSYREALDKDPHNVGARQDLFGKLYGDPNMHVGLSPENVRSNAKNAHDEAVDSMGKYARHNFDKMLDICDGESLRQIAVSGKLYRTDDAEHNKIVDIISTYQEMSKAYKAAQEGDPSKINKILMEKLKSDKIPGWAKKMIKGYSRDGAYMQEIFKRTLNAQNQLVMAALSKVEGDELVIDEDKVKTLIKESMKNAEKEWEREVDEDVKGDIWKKDIRPTYLAVANAAYQIERPKQDKDKLENDQSLREKEERRTDRANMGMSQ